MSEGFRRGSTPTNIFNVNIDLTGATVFVTYSQNNKTDRVWVDSRLKGE